MNTSRRRSALTRAGRRAFTAGLAAWTVLTPVTPILAADEPTSVAVLDFDPQGAPAGDAAILSEYVRQAFVARGDWTVVDRKNMSHTLQEQAIQQTGCTSSDCAVKLGKVLNVKKIVVGTYGIMEGGFRVITAQIVDVETSRIEKTAKAKGFQISNADDATAQLVNDLVGGQPAAAAPAPVPVPAPAPVASPAPGAGTAEQGTADGTADAKATVGGALWFFTGCCFGLFTTPIGGAIAVAVAYSSAPTPPPSRLIGRPSEYAVAYADAFSAQGKKKQGLMALAGCGVASALWAISIASAASANQATTNTAMGTTFP